MVGFKAVLSTIAHAAAVDRRHCTGSITQPARTKNSQKFQIIKRQDDPTFSPFTFTRGYSQRTFTRFTRGEC